MVEAIVIDEDSRLRAWRPGDDELLYEIAKSQPDYYRLSQAEASLAGIVRDWTGRPPRISADKKAYLVLETHRPVGLMDLILGYPQPDVLWIGLLLIHKQMEGKGLAKRACLAISRWAKEEGFRALGLAIISENKKARGFWQSLGFRPQGEIKDLPDYSVQVYELPLSRD